jgi:hypothetical protein
MDWKKHVYRVGSNEWADDELPTDPKELQAFQKQSRKHIEPWLSAVFQSEHLSLLLGSGFTTGIGYLAGSKATGMGTIKFGTKFEVQIDAHAKVSAKIANRGEANIEDQLRSALALLEGLRVMQSDADAKALREALNSKLKEFFLSLLATERGIVGSGSVDKKTLAERYLVSFLMSFASRAASRERLSIFTTNYDRLIEHGCDLAGLRLIDRFVGALNPVFRSSRVEVDIHYNPPGIRGEPRYLEGVVRLTKLHGSIDWRLEDRILRRIGIPFGAPDNHTDVPSAPIETVMIYPNPAKDMETTEYPYAELFRDFAAAACRPNSVLVTYGYSFGDDHINRVLEDMLTIPSTHLVIIGYENTGGRLGSFCEKIGRTAQISVLLGSHFGDLTTLVDHYLPKPAIDYITSRKTELLKNRGEGFVSADKGDDEEADAATPSTKPTETEE